MTDPKQKLTPEQTSGVRSFLGAFFSGLLAKVTPTAAIQWFLALWPAGLGAKIADKLRAAPLALVFLLTIAVVVYLAPQKAGLALFGVSKIAMGGYLGYWVDRLTFRDEDRPHKLEGISKGTAWKRRAVIVAASIIAAALIP